MYEDSFLIAKISPRLIEAKQLAHAEYDRYFNALSIYITHVNIRIVSGLESPIEGCVSYMIRVYVEAESKHVITYALFGHSLPPIDALPIGYYVE